jgi:hypothetical protein
MAARKPRKTASAARIRVHTDEYGRKVYSIVGTKKFAYTLAKAKEIASKTKKRKSSKSSTAMTVSSRKPAKRPAKRTTKKSARAKTDAQTASVVIRKVKGGLAGYKKARAAFKKDPETAGEKYGIAASRMSDRLAALIVRELKYEIDDLEGLGKKTTRRTTRRNPTAAERRAQAGDARTFSVSVMVARKVGERPVMKRLLGGKFTGKRSHRPVYEEVLAEGKSVRGRSAAIAEATRMISEVTGAANFRKYFYRQDTDYGPEAGLVQFFAKSGTDGEFTGYATIEPMSL